MDRKFQEAVLRKLDTVRGRQQIEKAVADAICTGRATAKITVRMVRANEKKDNRRFVLKGIQKTKEKV